MKTCGAQDAHVARFCRKLTTTMVTVSFLYASMRLTHVSCQPQHLDCQLGLRVAAVSGCYDRPQVRVARQAQETALQSDKPVSADNLLNGHDAALVRCKTQYGAL